MPYSVLLQGAPDRVSLERVILYYIPTTVCLASLYPRESTAANRGERSRLQSKQGSLKAPLSLPAAAAGNAYGALYQALIPPALMCVCVHAVRRYTIQVPLGLCPLSVCGT